MDIEKNNRMDNNTEHPQGPKDIFNRSMGRLARGLHRVSGSYLERTGNNSPYAKNFVEPLHAATAGHQNVVNAVDARANTLANQDAAFQQPEPTNQPETNNYIPTPAEKEMGQAYGNIAQELKDQSDQKAEEWDKARTSPKANMVNEWSQRLGSDPDASPAQQKLAQAYGNIGQDMNIQAEESATPLATQSDRLNTKANIVGEWAQRFNPNNSETNFSNGSDNPEYSVSKADQQDVIYLPESLNKQQSANTQSDKNVLSQVDNQNIAPYQRAQKFPDQQIQTSESQIPTDRSLMIPQEPDNKIIDGDFRILPSEEDTTLERKPRVMGDERLINKGSVNENDSRPLFRGKVFEEEARTAEDRAIRENIIKRLWNTRVFGIPLSDIIVDGAAGAGTKLLAKALLAGSGPSGWAAAFGFGALGGGVSAGVREYRTQRREFSERNNTILDPDRISDQERTRLKEKFRLKDIDKRRFGIAVLRGAVVGGIAGVAFGYLTEKAIDFLGGIISHPDIPAMPNDLGHIPTPNHIDLSGANLGGTPGVNPNFPSTLNAPSDYGPHIADNIAKSSPVDLSKPYIPTTDLAGNTLPLSEAVKVPDSLTMGPGSSIWSLSHEVAKIALHGIEPTNTQIQEVAKAMAQENHVRVPIWNINGQVLDTRMPTGTPVEIGSLTKSVLSSLGKAA